MADTVDAVARAIWEEDGKTDDGGKHWDIAWEQLTAPEQGFYSRLARAAIDALGLTEEWRCTGWVFTRDEDAAQKQRAANGGEIFSRLVSGWVRKDNTNE